MEAIRTIDLTRRYRDVVAVDGLNLSVEQGELFALLGVNGAGKTTLIRMLCCLCAPTSGDALLLGHSIAQEPAAVKALIGLSPQETAVAPNLTVAENLALMGGAHGFSREKIRENADGLCRQFSLEPVLHKRAGKLSGGWQRRLSLAMALMGDPKILFLDEPTLGLDVLARRDLWDTIRALKGNITLVLTTHYMEEAEALCDRVGVLQAGRLLALDTPEGLKRQAGTDSFEEAFVTIAREGSV